jgi:hypothetical protein
VRPQPDPEGAFIARVEQADGLGLSILVVVEEREIDLGVHGRDDLVPQLIGPRIIGAAVVVALGLLGPVIAVHLVLVVHQVVGLPEVVVVDRAGQAVLVITLGIQPRVDVVLRQGRRRIAEVDKNHQAVHHTRRMGKQVAWHGLVGEDRRIEERRIGRRLQVRPRGHFLAIPNDRRSGKTGRKSAGHDQTGLQTGSSYPGSSSHGVPLFLVIIHPRQWLPPGWWCKKMSYAACFDTTAHGKSCSPAFQARVVQVRACVATGRVQRLPRDRENPTRDPQLRGG